MKTICLWHKVDDALSPYVAVILVLFEACSETSNSDMVKCMQFVSIFFLSREPQILGSDQLIFMGGVTFSGRAKLFFFGKNRAKLFIFFSTAAKLFFCEVSHVLYFWMIVFSNVSQLHHY